MPGFSSDTEYTQGRLEVVNYAFEITSCDLIWAFLQNKQQMILLLTSCYI